MDETISPEPLYIFQGTVYRKTGKTASKTLQRLIADGRTEVVRDVIYEIESVIDDGDGAFTERHWVRENQLFVVND